MTNDILMKIVIGSFGAILILGIIYFIIYQRMDKSEYKRIRQLQKGTKEGGFSFEILYQKLYVTYLKLPFLKRYLLKIRRRLEIINIDDEYVTRRDASRILTKTILALIPIVAITVVLTVNNKFLMGILLLFELFMIDTLVDGSVDKIDSKLLKEQIQFFGEIRHAYHEFNMVEEAIYQVSQDDELNVSRQGEKIYEVLISDDPENELEKYYDVAPNSYLKEFAGVSYLTKEFGDRTTDEGSLYLKNVNNITQEMQLEILKRDKLDYVFQSLSVISITPILMLEPLKSWSVTNFSFTESFYYGKQGMIVQILILILTFVSYILTRILKDNGSTKMDNHSENPWQAKLYKKPIVKKVIDLFIPKQGTKEYRTIQNLLKDAASKMKMEWLFVNRIGLTILTFIVSIIIFGQLHNVAVDYVYNQPTTTYDVMGTLSDKERKTAMELTAQDNYFIDKFVGNLKIQTKDIQKEMKISKYYKEATEKEIERDAERVYKKIQTINSEYMKPLELLLSSAFAVLGYAAPILILKFQVKIRTLEMENEVMQFQTIIMMLMKIERVNVEIILEWLERYSNIFREPISKCVNNYEAGAWEALEEFKNDVSFQPMTRIIESLQAAVEKIPIIDAFDELDSERDYYKEKRKESNDRLITRKGMIGKVIGFAPMVVLFCGYLIAPLVVIGLTVMSTAFSNMSGL